MTDEPFSAEFTQEFYGLYEKLRRERFDPTLPTLNHNLKTLLDAKFGASPRLRLRVEAGRIKSANRLLLKAQLRKYRSKIVRPEDVFRVIRDIVGTRITCNTINDAYAVADAIKAVATNGLPNRTLLQEHEDFEDDYIKTPKESGYRALSLVVGVPVAIGDHTECVTCEIQIRTLLQHAWGELTHEDTYKPEMKTPALIVILSKRLANTLAVLDEIAQDIRNELDKLETEQAAPAAVSETTPATQSVATAPSSESTDKAQDGNPSAVEPKDVDHESQPSSAPEIEAQTLQRAFEVVFGRAPELVGKQVATLLEVFGGLGITEVASVEKALREMSKSVEPIEARYEKSVYLTDFGRLLHSARFARDPDSALQEVEQLFESYAQKLQEKKVFEATYPVGKELLGTVVHVASDYALVQLPEGVTGIMHVTAMKTNPHDYLDVHELVAEGETIRVRIATSNAETKRVELRLVRS